ncbi:MAG: ribosome biogenesis GTPase Der [Bacteroidia bacterium]|nr:ribosome biogenesis GTPase Der [Bacteroidia bacterium]
MANIVAIVGRPNVGKSTLFNRLTESRKAIVDEIAGVTRDRHYGKCEWGGLEFTVIDTGGYVIGSEDIFEDEIRKQVRIAVEEANVILFLVDVVEGITDMDTQVAHMLRKCKKKVILVVNKVDNNKRMVDATEFYALGMGDYFTMASATGSGTGDILDEVLKNLDREVPLDDIYALPKFAIVGRPNVGKSSLLNALMGEERNIVTDVAGTTRDTLHTHYNKFGHNFILVDTAGIRRKTKVHEDLEFYSVMRAVHTIEECDVVILVIDATVGFDSQDMNLFGLAIKNRKGIVMVVNKWDLIQDKTNSTLQEYADSIIEKLAPFRDVPIIFTSATTKQRILDVMDMAVKVHQNRIKKIKTSVLNEFLQDVVDHNPPPANKGKYIKIKFFAQLPTHAPTFAIYCNSPQYVRDDYKRFIENKLRKEYDFTGVPLQIFFRQK